MPAAPDSRYADLPVLEVTAPDGNVRRVVGLRLRRQDTGPTVGVHQLAAHEPLDLLARRLYGGEGLWWRILDANPVRHPLDLVPGDLLALPRPHWPAAIEAIFAAYWQRGEDVTRAEVIGQALREQPMTVYDDGSRTRSFCFVSDLVEGIVKLMEYSEHEPVNLGNPLEMKILEFAQIVQRLTQTKSEIVFVTPTDERTKDDPQVRRPDISRAPRSVG